MAWAALSCNAFTIATFSSFVLCFLLFYQYTASTAGDGHQMYPEGSVVDIALTVGPEISPTPPLIFTGVEKCDSRITEI